MSLNEKAELFLLAALAAAAELAVKTVSLPRLTRALGIALVDYERDLDQGVGSRAASGLSEHEVTRRARAVDRLYRAWPRKSSCLRRALVLGYRIRRAHPILFIGVAKRDGAIRAHAWIEVDGAVVGEDTGEFAPLHSHRSAG
jgi:hypothetical protein